MSGKNQQSKMDVKQKSVLNAPLHQHSSTGMCTSQSPLALVLTTSFLDFSASQGTDLRSQPGARICADAKLWKQAVDKGMDGVPRVKLEGTHQSALDSVGLDVLKKYAAEQDNGGAERRVAKPGQDSRGIVKESQEIGGKEPRA